MTSGPFGENYRHFHALVAARGAEVPPEARGRALLQLLAAGRDVPAAQAVAGDVRLAYEEIVRGREHAAVVTRGRSHVRTKEHP